MIAKLAIACLCCSVCVHGSAESESSLFRIRVEQKAIDYILKLALQLFHRELTNLNIPDLSGDFPVIFGTAHYVVSNIKGTDSDLVDSNLKVALNPLGVTASATGVHISLSANWAYKAGGLIEIRDSGSLDMTATFDFNITASSGSNNGLPSFNISHCTFQSYGVKAEFHGGASWLYNLFSKAIDGFIKHALNNNACANLKNAANKLGKKELDSLNLNLTLSDGVILDLFLTKPPQFNSDYVESFHKGEFTFGGWSQSWEINSSVITPQTNKMFYLFVTEPMIYSFAIAYWRAGAFRKNVSSETVGWNTSFLGFFIPNLMKKYPNKPMKFDVYLVKPMPFSLCEKNQTIRGLLVVDIDAYVLFPENGTDVHVFTLEVTSNVQLKPILTKTNSHLTLTFDRKLTSLTSKISVKESSIGNIQADVLEVPLDIAIPGYLARTEKKGFPLPITCGINFIEPEVNITATAIVVGTDISFDPQKSGCDK